MVMTGGVQQTQQEGRELKKGEDILTIYISYR